MSNVNVGDKVTVNMDSPSARLIGLNPKKQYKVIKVVGIDDYRKENNQPAFGTTCKSDKVVTLEGYVFGNVPITFSADFVNVVEKTPVVNTPQVVTKPSVSREPVPEYALTLAVENGINVLVKEGYSFTAYDITKLLRKKNPNSNVMHDDVRTNVENHFAFGVDGYTRTVAQGTNLELPPQVYHPINANVGEYRLHIGPQKLPVLQVDETNDDEVYDSSDDISSVTTAVTPATPRKGFTKRFFQTFFR